MMATGFSRSRVTLHYFGEDRRLFEEENLHVHEARAQDT